VQKRRLGRTGLMVSQVGFGAYPISRLELPQAVQVARRAYELGVNYYDTARMYGDSEEKLGAALHDVRDDVILATKCHLRTAREARVLLKQSLRKLRTNVVDLVQLHGMGDLFNDEAAVKQVMGPDGAFEALKEARRMGQVHFLGISGHRPKLLVKAIDTGEFDQILVSMNLFTRYPYEELLSHAAKNDVGVVIMKPFGGLGFIADTPEFHRLFGTSLAEKARRALRFLLAHDVATIVPGLSSVEETELAVHVGESFKGLTAEEEQLYRLKEDLLTGQCRECTLCLPCPELIDIPGVLRLIYLAETFGLKDWAGKSYRGLPFKAQDCTRCGVCEPRCPYGLPIIAMLQHAEDAFKLPGAA